MKKRTKVNISDRLGGGGVRGLTTIYADQRERGNPLERESIDNLKLKLELKL